MEVIAFAVIVVLELLLRLEVGLLVYLSERVIVFGFVELQVILEILLVV